MKLRLASATVALATVLLMLCAPASTSAQGLDSIPVLEATLLRVSFVDRDGSVIGTTAVPGFPNVGARGADGSLWVGTISPAFLTRIDTSGVAGPQVALTSDPGGVAIDDQGRAWVSLPDEGRVEVYNAAGIFVVSYLVGAGPRGLSIDEVGNCWVANSGSGTISRITTFGLVLNYLGGAAPTAIAAAGTGGAWFTDGANSIQFIDISGTITQTIGVGATPRGIAVDGESQVWVTVGDALVFRFSSGGQPLGMYTVGSEPTGISVDGRGRIWVTCPGSAAVHRIDPRTDDVVAFSPFAGAGSLGDVTGFAHARLVAPGLDIDGDGTPSGIEIDHACNPFDPVTPEIGRASPREGSVEGGGILTLEGCGFLSLASPQVQIGGQPVASTQVIDDAFIEATLAAHPVSDLLSIELFDGNTLMGTAEESFRYLRNPGQLWLESGSGASLVRIAIDSEGERGPVSSPIPIDFAPRGVAVDGLGGVWFTEEGGGGVRRLTADGVLTDSWSLAGASLTGIAVDALGRGWALDVSNGSVHTLLPGGASDGPFPVGMEPHSIAATRSGELWVTDTLGDVVHRLDSDGSLLNILPVGLEPRGLAVDSQDQVWVVTGGNGFLSRVHPGIGTVETIAIGAGPTDVVIDAFDTIWVTLSGEDGLARVTSTGIVTVIPTGPMPRGLTLDGAGHVWVTHELSGELRRYDPQGLLVETISAGTARIALGDFGGRLPIQILEPADDHDGDGLCNGSELFHETDPYRPEVSPDIPFSYLGILPRDGLQTGGYPLTIRGCGFLSASGITAVLGGQPLSDLVVTDDENLTATAPPFDQAGIVDLIINSDQGLIFATQVFRYRAAPVEEVTCVQDGVPVTITWTEPQPYDSVSIRIDDVEIAAVTGGVGSFTQATPPLGSITYQVVGIRDADEADAVECSIDIVLNPPSSFACSQSAGSVIITWDLGDTYEELVIRRDGAEIVTLSGDATQHIDELPTAGLHGYDIVAHREGFESFPQTCGVDFVLIPLTDLTCTTDFDLAQLSWSSIFPYGTYRIERDGALLAEIPGTESSFDDTGVDEGDHDYTVIGLHLGDSSPGQACAVTVPVRPVETLTCDASVFDVDLQWTPGIGDYDAIRVTRNGVEIAVLPGSATGYTDSGVAVGSYDYDVVGEKNGTLSEVVSCSVEVIGPIFIRGDYDGDTILTLADAISSLNYITGMGTEPGCFDAADANDTGSIDLADPIYALFFLFSGGPEPPAPFPLPGPDPTPDALDCATSL